ncbi:MAG: SGNH/GDSL hydrolase family protein [Phycisphaerae bacterium]|nr:SGNH/GDSL hydrolase family protein [Phycisphaerae bacterium]
MGRANRLLRFMAGAGCIYFAFATALLLALIRIDTAHTGLGPRYIPLLFASMYTHGASLLLCTVVWILARRLPIGSMRTPRIAAMAAALLFTISLDQGVGLFYPPAIETDTVYTPHARRGWYHRPMARASGTFAGEPVSTDAFGLRVAPAAPPRRATGRRILFLGDSVTYGYGVSFRQTFSEQVRRALSDMDGGQDWDCINGGVAGYAAWQGGDLLREIGAAVQPTVVVAQFCINDVSDVLGVEPGQTRAAVFPEFTLRSTHWSGLYRFVDSIVTEARVSRWRDWNLWGQPIATRDGDDPFWDHSVLFTEPLRPDIEAAWQRALDDLGEMLDECRRINARFLIVYFPFRDQLEPAASIDYPQRRLANWAARQGIEMVDLTPVFRSAAHSTGAVNAGVLFDAVHPTARGFELAASIVGPALARELLIAEGETNRMGGR